MRSIVASVMNKKIGQLDALKSKFKDGFDSAGQSGKKQMEFYKSIQKPVAPVKPIKPVMPKVQIERPVRPQRPPTIREVDKMQWMRRGINPQRVA